jgi:hypothetical protein
VALAERVIIESGISALLIEISIAQSRPVWLIAMAQRLSGKVATIKQYIDSPDAPEKP